ncbi:DNA-binding response OmpR family regulator [Loktanella sp. PT4BL]|jgi:DNA-binding response OmpR family regulator|uniref:response regulator n=1 Tax=Loktanella sp. PT4BL TaxID=2135611 RepID=UPI000D758B43|nr:response regulator [Loktanella sp. PT4BL]PXW69340.1 DNA-binding response OmpR family regulator [Loktanella sp. PT4BL]
MISQKILIVDDDPKIRLLLRRCLEDNGFAVLEAETKADVFATLRRHEIKLLLLDVQLENDNGFEIAKCVRKETSVPIVMVSGQDDVIDRVVGLEIGADDYIAKPFHLREVLARVRSVLRRSSEEFQVARIKVESTLIEEVLIFDGMIARLNHFELLNRNGDNVILTSGEFKLLKVFLQNPKRILSRDRLIDLLCDAQWAPNDRTIDTQVARLRRKIERDPRSPKVIKTVRGVGYVFAADVRSS